jgi:hypothetical protein
MSAEKVNSSEESASRETHRSLALVRSGEMERIVKHSYRDSQCRVTLTVTAAHYEEHAGAIEHYRRWLLQYGGWRFVPVDVI